jgi:hypothetical protein
MLCTVLFDSLLLLLSSSLILERLGGGEGEGEREGGGGGEGRRGEGGGAGETRSRRDTMKRANSEVRWTVFSTFSFLLRDVMCLKIINK